MCIRDREELFCSLGSRLGYLDLEMQMKELLLYEEELTRRTEAVSYTHLDVYKRQE